MWCKQRRSDILNCSGNILILILFCCLVSGGVENFLLDSGESIIRPGLCLFATAANHSISWRNLFPECFVKSLTSFLRNRTFCVENGQRFLTIRDCYCWFTPGPLLLSVYVNDVSRLASVHVRRRHGGVCYQSLRLHSYRPASHDKWFVKWKVPLKRKRTQHSSFPGAGRDKYDGSQAATVSRGEPTEGHRAGFRQSSHLADKH